MIHPGVIIMAVLAIAVILVALSFFMDYRKRGFRAIADSDIWPRGKFSDDIPLILPKSKRVHANGKSLEILSKNLNMPLSDLALDSEGIVTTEPLVEEAHR